MAFVKGCVEVSGVVCALRMWLSVVVLAPNGLKQTVRCTQNTLIIQIIEQVGRKQGFDPSKFDIKHHNKILDATTTFRASDLPNNAQLELVAAVKNREEGYIRLIVDYEDFGMAPAHKFAPSDTIKDVLNKTYPQIVLPKEGLVVRYRNCEMFGEELEYCTLRSLGVVGRNGTITVLNMDPEFVRQQANVKEKRKAQEARRIQKKKKKAEEKVQNDDIESMEVNVPSNTKENVIHQKSIDEEFDFCGERNGMIFSLQSAQSVPSEDLPNEKQQLQTSQLRSLEVSKKQTRQLNRYKRAVIRVHFPDRTVVQGTFEPTETIQHVLNFIRSYLEDQNIEFYIYSTPPKYILSQTSRLIDVGCVPAALLYFGTNVEQKENLLRKDLQDMFTTNSVASLAAARIRKENTRNVEGDPDDDDVYIDATDNTDNNSVPVNYGASTSSGSSFWHRNKNSDLSARFS